MSTMQRKALSDPEHFGRWPLSSGLMSVDPRFPTLNDTPQPWRCPYCGTVVPSGDSHTCPLPDPLEVARSLLAESMVPLDGPAFEKAREEFGRAYAHVFAAHPSFDRGVECEDESLVEALQACIGTYLREAGQ